MNITLRNAIKKSQDERIVIGITEEHIGCDVSDEQVEWFVEALNKNLARYKINVEALVGNRGFWPEYEDGPLDGNLRFDAAWNESMDAL